MVCHACSTPATSFDLFGFVIIERVLLDSLQERQVTMDLLLSLLIHNEKRMQLHVRVFLLYIFSTKDCKIQDI